MTVLVAAFNRDASGHQAARSKVLEWLAGPTLFYLTWPIVYEFLRVVTHRAVFPRPAPSGDAWRFVAAVLGSAPVRLLVNTERHEHVLAELIEECPWASGSLLHDLHTVALMREHGIREIRTADSDFLKFRFLRVVDPLEA